MNKYEYNVYMISNFKFRKGYDENGYYYYYYGEDVVTGALSYECWDVHTGTHYVYDIVSSEWHVLTLNTREIFWASCYDIPESDWDYTTKSGRPGQYTKCTKTYGTDGLTLDANKAAEAYANTAYAPFGKFVCCDRQNNTVELATLDHPNQSFFKLPAGYPLMTKEDFANCIPGPNEIEKSFYAMNDKLDRMLLNDPEYQEELNAKYDRIINSIPANCIYNGGTMTPETINWVLSGEAMTTYRKLKYFCDPLGGKLRLFPHRDDTRLMKILTTIYVVCTAFNLTCPPIKLHDRTVRYNAFENVVKQGDICPAKGARDSAITITRNGWVYSNVDRRNEFVRIENENGRNTI